MATALRLTDFLVREAYVVASGDTATKGEAVLLDSDTTIDDCDGVSDLAIGVALEAGTPGDVVEVGLFGWGIVPVIVGTNGATRGMKAQLEGDGFTDAGTHDSDGGVANQSTYGIFLQSGTAGQFVGLLLAGAGNRGT